MALSIWKNDKFTSLCCAFHEPDIFAILFTSSTFWTKKVTLVFTSSDFILCGSISYGAILKSLHRRIENRLIYITSTLHIWVKIQRKPFSFFFNIATADVARLYKLLSKLSLEEIKVLTSHSHVISFLVYLPFLNSNLFTIFDTVAYLSRL